MQTYQLKDYSTICIVHNISLFVQLGDSVQFEQSSTLRISTL